MSDENEKTPSIPVRVLLVDNDKDHARAMHESLERIGLECSYAISGPEGAKMLDENTYEIVVTDLMMNDVDGMAILKKAKDIQENCEVVLVTGHATVPRAVEAMRERAFNFLEKPITPKRLQAVVSKAAESVRLRLQNTHLQTRLDERYGFENLIFASDSMKSVVDRLKRIAPTDYWRNGNRQRRRRSSDSPKQPAKEKAVCGNQYGRRSRTFGRKRIVRSCQRRVHRCHC